MIIEYDNINAQLHPENSEDKKVVKSLENKYRFYTEGAFFSQAYRVYKKTYGRMGWDGKVSLIKNGTFDTGLIPRVIKDLQARGITPGVTDRRFLNAIALMPTTVPLRDYQYECLSTAFSNTQSNIWWPRGVLHMSTGSGKTELATAMIQMAVVPTIFFVHLTHLLDQAYERLQKYGVLAGRIGSGHYEINSPVIVTTVQSIGAILRNGVPRRSKKKDITPTPEQVKKRNEIIKLLAGMHQVFFDESHIIASKGEGANMLKGINDLLPRAYMRWGLTATPFMRDKYSNLLLESAAGDVLYCKPSSELIEEGWLTPPEITMVDTNSQWGLGKIREWRDIYDLGVVLNDHRNGMIASIAKDLPTPCLILCKRKVHAEILAKKLNIPVISGDLKGEDRTKAIKDIRSGKLPMAVATTVFDEGVDIPEIKSIVLAGGGKSQVKSIQRIGRGLRLAENKDKVIIYDFYDLHHKMLMKHSKERLKTYEGEGFEVKRKVKI
jgi:superfamily II DNA or RNA helicase